jgi:hypothetical protein
MEATYPAGRHHAPSIDAGDTPTLGHPATFLGPLCAIANRHPREISPEKLPISGGFRPASKQRKRSDQSGSQRLGRTKAGFCDLA